MWGARRTGTRRALPPGLGGCCLSCAGKCALEGEGDVSRAAPGAVATCAQASWVLPPMCCASCPARNQASLLLAMAEWKKQGGKRKSSVNGESEKWSRAESK